MKMTDLGTLMYLISRGARSSILMMLNLQVVSTKLTNSRNASGRIGAPNVTAVIPRCAADERVGWLGVWALQYSNIRNPPHTHTPALGGPLRQEGGGGVERGQQCSRRGVAASPRTPPPPQRTCAFHPSSLLT